MVTNLLIALTNVCWGVWGIFDKKALGTSEPRKVLLIQYALALPEMMIILAYIYLSHGQLILNQAAVLWGVIGAMTAMVAMVAYMIAMSRTEASYVLGITASYPLVMQVLATIFLNEPLVLARIIGGALIGGGVFAIGYSASDAVQKHTKKERRLISACVLAATIGWGVHGLFDKKAVECAAPMAVLFIRSCFDFCGFICMAIVVRKLKLSTGLADSRTWTFCALSALCLLVGSFCYLKAMAVFNASYVIVITGCYPLLMYILAVVFLREKLNPFERWGWCL